MNCKNCNTPMERVFHFDTKGEACRILECPNCGARTSAKELTYTEKGNVVIATDKKGKPTLVYQVANPEADNYGNVIKVKQKFEPKNKKPQGKKSGKPFHKRKRKKEKTD